MMWAMWSIEERGRWEGGKGGKEEEEKEKEERQGRGNLNKREGEMKVKRVECG